ncbi:MAG: hypothetical protein EPN37_14280 [Chitinophagaceae bacterium]|nr:MAG: hypothetical protein EPN37_14280 [Chitinophagaceae bacterium]
MRILREVMLTQSQFVKVHAAEYLIWAGHPDSVRDVFLKEEQLYGTESPYRIGIWRVLEQVAGDKNEKSQWIDSIQNAFLNVNGKDRINAAETLAKLKIIPAPGHPAVVQKAIEGEATSLSLYTLWAASNSGADSLKKCREKLFHLLTSDQADSLQKTLASYILRHIDDLDSNEWSLLASKALAEPDSSLAKVYMLSAAYITVPEDSIRTGLYEKIKAQLINEDKSPRVGSRTELSAVLAEKGTPADLPVLFTMLNNKYPLEKESDNADVRSAAAYAILEIGKRMKQ